MKIALVTGGNRGIGFEVCRQLASKECQVILTSRSKQKGEEAVRKLAAENLKVSFQQLDVTDQQSVDRTVESVLKEFGRVDILVNNAGVYLDKSTAEGGSSILTTDIGLIQKTLDTNTFGPLRLIQKIAPSMRKNNYGRIVNMSSGMGQLTEMNGGYAGYRISKTALNAVTRITADEMEGTNVLVNSVCPGWVKTDMGGPEAELTPEEGADTVVWLAMLPEGGPTGGFFRERKKIDW